MKTGSNLQPCHKVSKTGYTGWNSVLILQCPVTKIANDETEKFLEYGLLRGGAMGGGGQGGKSPPKDFKKGENEKIWGIFRHQSY